jgi:hypothetical protein
VTVVAFTTTTLVAAAGPVGLVPVIVGFGWVIVTVGAGVT